MPTIREETAARILLTLAEIWMREHGQLLRSVTIRDGDGNETVYLGGKDDGKICKHGDAPAHLVADPAAGA